MCTSTYCKKRLILHSERNKVYMTAAHGKLAVVSACTNKLMTAGYAE